ncbi:YibE/F family protein [Ihubacter massiliensis]|uniref:YibE/F family protein n=1 Tax=Hominibacterium faecale TaxID=2839743 RepID=A0A9J6QXQ4_9FIRM|nr:MULTISPECIES: YibE/F family protein [Eubacteriales Family XIII. Incertae Sedis]MCO7123621.1 YibE/F family protein [Ihubacter massiliensis]MCU7380275.1 YibE/F family protein [Hominibacterium faecale]
MKDILVLYARDQETMNNSKGKIRFVLELLIVCVLSLLFIMIGNRICGYIPGGAGETDVESAKVIKLVDIREEIIEGLQNTVIVFQAEMLTGDEKGQALEMEQIINDVTIDKPNPVEVKDRILVSNTDLMGNATEDAQWYYLQQDRIPGMLCLAAIFLILLLIIGKLKGLTTIISLAFTGAAVFCVYIPAILSGKDVYLTTIIITIYIIFSSLILLNGFNKKTLCAIVGNIGGILATGVLAFVVNYALKITGMVNEDYVFLAAIGDDSSIDLRAIVWSGIMIGSLGAIMDVSMSIASAMQELAVEMKDRTFKRMVSSGMNIGRDAIGTMTITLILAYAGSSIASILLFTLNNRNLLILMNFEMIVVEVIQAIVGSLGILLAVPITVLFAGATFNKNKKAPGQFD